MAPLDWDGSLVHPKSGRRRGGDRPGRRLVVAAICWKRVGWPEIRLLPAFGRSQQLQPTGRIEPARIDLPWSRASGLDPKTRFDGSSKGAATAYGNWASGSGPVPGAQAPASRDLRGHGEGSTAPRRSRTARYERTPANAGWVPTMATAAIR